MIKHFSVAAVQMISTDIPADNMRAAQRLTQEAVSLGADLVVLPEYFCLLSPVDSDKWKYAESFGSGPLQDGLAEIARQCKVWLVGGTLPIRAQQPGKVFNTQLVFSPAGECIARYDKIHLFNYSNQSESYDEGRSVSPGDKPVSVQLPFGKIGLSTCYDLRFPELYRSLGPVDLILVPAAFTATTGRAHWEPLLRARAIENQAYVLAAAQGGEHPGKRRTWGHSMLIDPWGDIKSQLEFGEGVLVGSVDLHRVKQVREDLPALNHRVLGN